MRKKKILLYGSTGSIGTQALDILAAHADRFELLGIVAGKSTGLFLEQVKRFNPKKAVLTAPDNPTLFKQAQEEITDTQLECGADAALELAGNSGADIVLTAVVGYAGLLPTIAAIRAGADIALANKETLVVAGEYITRLAQEHGVKLLPVDSEHSAIFQCLTGEPDHAVEKIILTASGGPFRGKDKAFLEQVTPEQALKHPNWVMGSKITIDSASLMNKGLEVIEARWLFGLKPEQIEVVIHPQSIIHSMVQFKDSSLKAQMGVPDMRLPILHAFSWPDRPQSELPRIDFSRALQLDFYVPDRINFPNLDLAYEALRRGGNAPCILNAANEIAVESFLQKKISFTDIPRMIEHCLQHVSFASSPNLDDFIQTDTETRIVARTFI